MRNAKSITLPASQIAYILRSFAAASIVIFHVLHLFIVENASPQWFYNPNLIRVLSTSFVTANPLHILNTLVVNFGYLAVSIFIILSGWGLTYINLKRNSSSLQLWSFLKQRLIKLYPLYFLAIIISVCIAAVLHIDFSIIAVTFISQALLVHIAIPQLFNMINASLWFVPVILVLYLCFPFLYQQIQKRPVATLIYSILFSIVLSYAFYLTPIHNWHPYLAQGGFPLTRLGEFVFGMWLATVLQKKKEISSHELTTVFIFGLVLIFIGVISLTHPLTILLHKLLLGSGIIFASAAPLFLITKIPSISRILEYAGKYSYGLYLFHFPILSWFVITFWDSPLLKYPLITGAGLMITIWGVSIPVQRYVERITRPLLKE